MVTSLDFLLVPHVSLIGHYRHLQPGTTCRHRKQRKKERKRERERKERKREKERKRGKKEREKERKENLKATREKCHITYREILI